MSHLRPLLSGQSPLQAIEPTALTALRFLWDSVHPSVDFSSQPSRNGRQRAFD
jgi:hypothetical protein